MCVFVRFEGAGVMRRFLLCTPENISFRKSLQLEWRFSASFNKIYPHGAQEWNVNWMNKTGDDDLES